MRPFASTSQSPEGETTSGLARVTSPEPTLEAALWLVVLVAMVLDIATTAYGLSVGLVERNPVVRAALDAFGVAALAAIKVGALALALACRRAWPASALVVPLGLAIPWSLAVGINLALILSV
jgi:hypothetical protein